MPTADRSLRRDWLICNLAIAIAAGVAWLGWWATDSARMPRDVMPPPAAGGIAATPVAQAQSSINFSSKPLSATEPVRVADPVGNAPDLKRIFDEFIASGVPHQRRMAVQAFEACVPAFLSGPGQAPSPEPLIRALPLDQNQTKREGAYRTLFGRCHRLLAEGEPSLVSTQKFLQSDLQNQAPGLRAQDALLAGRLERIDPLVGDALSQTDPAAVASLSGLAARIVQWRQPDVASAALIQRALDVDTALPWVACDLGLACGAQSLWALQLCAVEGVCEGDVSTRLIARISPGTIDTAAVQQQRLRLLSLIRSGRTLNTADLLPLTMGSR